MYTINHLSHTADVRLKLEADTIEELYKAGMISMCNLQKTDFVPGNGTPDLFEKIVTESVDKTTLFIDFLSDVLTLSHTQKAIYYSISIVELTDHHISATIGGKRTSGFDEDIKAVTYHEADVHLNDKNNWETMLILDI